MFLATVLSADAATLSVTPESDASAVLAAAGDGDTVEFAPGTYTLDISLSARMLTLIGLGEPQHTVLAGIDSEESLHLVNSQITIRNLTIRPNNSEAQAGIYAESTIETPAQLTLEDVILEDAHPHVVDLGNGDVERGTQLLARNVDVILRRVTFLPAETGSNLYGGSTAILGGSLLTDEVTFNNGRAEWGGALYLEDTTGTLINTRLQGGIAESGGGCLYMEGSTVSLQGGILTECAAQDGGAIYAWQSQLELSGSTLSLNSAVGGGALDCEGSTCTISDSTLAENEADQGGAINVLGGSLLELTRNELFGNTATSGAAIEVASNNDAHAYNNVFCGNRSTGADEAILGGGERVFSENNNYIGNVSEQGGVLGTAVNPSSINDLFAYNSTPGGETLESLWVARYALTFNNSTDTPSQFIDSLLQVDPMLQQLLDPEDCSNSDYRPSPASPLIGAGDPDRLNPDGSRSDIGAFGGQRAYPDFWMDADADGWIDRLDCAPDSAVVHPDAQELCNQADDDCDGTADDGLDCAPNTDDPLKTRESGLSGCSCSEAGVTQFPMPLLVGLLLMRRREAASNTAE